ncbi:hypothetical protein PCE1_000545 [Barthelona sp. PCE]
MVVGIGSMTLPQTFAKIGIILTVAVIVVLAFFSYISATYVLEAMANTNAILRAEKEQNLLNGEAESEEASAEEKEMENSINSVKLDIDGITSPYKLKTRIEYSKMANLYFSDGFKLFFTLIFCFYFLGDLAIYTVGAPNTLQQWVDFEMDFMGMHLTDMALQRFFLIAFAIIVVPLCLADMQNTKILQIITLGLRLVAFYTMIILGALHVMGGRTGGMTHVPMWDFKNVGAVLGSTVYSFMSHHSLPSMLTPIKAKNKSKTTKKTLLADFFTIGISYILLSSTAMLAFSDPNLPDHCELRGTKACKIQDLYFKNFASYDNVFIDYFMLGFPLIVFVTIWPMIAITLRNNIDQLLPKLKPKLEKMRKPICVALAILPPLTIGWFTNNVTILVRFTGGLCGVFIMFTFPAFFVKNSREKCEELNIVGKNEYKSFFQSKFWINAVLGWSGLMFLTNVWLLIKFFINGE